MKMNDEEKKNLKSLLKLEKMELKSKFDMGPYCLKNGSIMAQSKVTPDDYGCCTVACFLGHLPLASGISKRADERWVDYGRRLLGEKLFYSDSFGFLFSGEGRSSETEAGSLEQAIARLKVFIKNGYKTPEGFNGSIDSYTKLY